jgi:hypothetical protein
MSHDSEIKVSTADYPGMINAIDIVDALLNSGWTMDVEGDIRLYLGDGDWAVFNILEESRVLSRIGQRGAAETIGISLRWQGTSHGLDVLFVENSPAITFSLTIHRRQLGNMNFTDVSWYLERVLPALVSSGLKIEELTRSEFR